MLMQMSDEGEPSFNLRLIEAVKHSRCLYDSTDRQYRSAEYKMKVWNRLVQLLQFEGGDSRALYNRWKQLRDKYGKEKKKIKYSGEMSTWQYYKHLTFLDPHMTDRQVPKCQTITTKDGKQIVTEMQFLVTDAHFNSNLIEEVKQHSCLFDIRDPKYRHTDCRNQSWHQIIKNLNFPGDINAIYKQWKKLRDRYVREKRRLRTLSSGMHEESSWDLYRSMTWMDTYLDDRASHFSHGKRKRPDMDEMSDDGYMMDDMHGRPQSANGMGYMVLDKASQRAQNQNAQGDVLLDGDSAFAASAVSDLRSLPENSRQLAKVHIENLLETGRMPVQQIVHFDMK